MFNRGEIYYADMGQVVGSEQGGIRPVVIIQNDNTNRTSTTTIVAPITTATAKHNATAHVWLDNSCGLPKPSMVLCEQIRVLDKKRFNPKTKGKVSNSDMKKIEAALKRSLQLV